MSTCSHIIRSGSNSGSICGRKLNTNQMCRYHGLNQRILPNLIRLNSGIKQQIKKERKDNTCSICLNEVAMYNFKKYNGIHILNCGHKMHGICYQSFLFKCENSRFCPLCRKEQIENKYQKELTKLQTEIRQLNETLRYVQSNLTKEEEDSQFWMQRYRKWKQKYNILLNDYHVLGIYD